MMKRTWIGVFLIGMVLAGGVWLTVRTNRILEPAAENIRQAQMAAMKGEWPRARLTVQQTREQWSRRWRECACVLNRETMERIDGCFEELAIYGTLEDRGHFAANCAEAAQTMEARVHESRPFPWNLL